MNQSEKKSFLEAISLQIQRYKGCIDNRIEYAPNTNLCPMCRSYFGYDNHNSHKQIAGPCGKCPMFPFSHNNFHDKSWYPCGFRLTYPTEIRDLINTYNRSKELKYEFDAEKCANNFWTELGKLVKRTPPKNIDLSENSKFVMQMFMLDKDIRAVADKEIDEKYKPVIS